LKLTWDHPVYQSTDERSDATAVKAARTALSAEQAFRFIAGNDPRPLLVLRECARCNQTDRALLAPGADNEKVLFLTRWFHCVKLPVDVVQSNHPFNALFPTNDAEHLFVAMRDGSVRIPLESDTSRVELCTAMSTVLSGSYVKDPAALYRDLHSIGDHLDMLDRRLKDLEAKRAELMESNGSGSKTGDKQKIAKIESEITATQKEIDQKVASFQKSSSIQLRPSDSAAKAKEPAKS